MDRCLGVYTVRFCDHFGLIANLSWLQAMSLSYAASFWPVPFFSQIQSEIAVEVGASAGEGAWYVLQRVRIRTYI
jgi:hypothetical protein